MYVQNIVNVARDMFGQNFYSPEGRVTLEK